MAIASLLVRIGAQDQEIQNALASIGEKAKSVDADLKKLGGSPLANQAIKSFDAMKATLDQVTQAQQRMADRATLAAKGLEAMGGTSRLTESQLKQVNKTLQEGLSAYQALGQSPPAALKRIADETGRATRATEGWKDSLKGLGGAIAAAFSVQQVIQFGSAILRMADDIVRTSDRTGLLTSEVQKLNFIAGQSGNSLDELIGAVGQMQNRLASGDKSAINAVKVLGISLNELRAAGPYQQLELLADAVSKIPDPAGRAAVAMDLFGRTGIAILPTLIANFKELGDAAPVMSENTVRALDTAGDQLEKFQLQVKVWAAESYNTLSGVFDRLTTGILRTTAGFMDAVANILSVPLKIPGAEKAFAGFAQGLKDVHERAQFARDAAAQLEKNVARSTETVRKATPAFTALGAETLKAQQDAENAAKKQAAALAELTGAYKPLTAAQEQQIDAYAKQGRSASLLATAFGLNELAVKDYIERVKILNTVVPESTLAMADWSRMFSNAALQSGLTQINRDIGTLTDTLDNFIRRFRGAELFPDWTDSINNLQKALLSNPDLKMIGEKMTQGMALKANLHQFFTKDFGATVIAALQGGGSAIQSALSSFGAKLFGEDSQFAKNIKGGITKLFGKSGIMGQIGGAISSFLPSFGALLGPAFAGLQKLFGKSVESREVSPRRDAFFKSQGGLENLNPIVQDLTGNLKLVQALFDARTPQAYDAAVADLNETLRLGAERFEALQAGVGQIGEKLGGITELTPELESALAAVFDQSNTEGYLTAVQALNREIDAQAAKYDTVRETLDKYGIAFKDAGKQFQQSNINKRAQELVTDFKNLKSVSVDANAIMVGMGKSLNQFIKDAQLAGVEVPEAMKEVIQVGIDAGQVFDKDGKAIKTMDELGLKFGTTMETTMKTVATSVDRLGLVLEGLAKFLGITLPKAAKDGVEDINEALDDIDNPVIKPRFEWPKDFPETPTAPPLEFARGSGGIRDFGSGTPAILHGREAVVTEADLKRGTLAAVAPAPVVVHMTINVDGVFSDGDLVQTVQKHIEPIVRQTWEDNVNGARTNAQDILGVP